MPDRPFVARAKGWATKRGLFGPQAFSKYVMFSFLDAISSVSDDFVLKGGNLLWLYIGTPRATTDLDLVTKTLSTHEEVRKVLEAAGDKVDGIHFKIDTFSPVDGDSKKGVAVVMAFKTEKGAANKLELDIVYAVGVSPRSMASPIGGKTPIAGASIENILADKLAACTRFGAGNSRLKDFDDLWRIAKANPSVDAIALKSLLLTQKAAAALSVEWLGPEMEASWRRHVSRYKDLPGSLRNLMDEFNTWIGGKLA